MNNVSELLIATLMMLFSLSVPSYACYDDDEDDCYIYCEDEDEKEDEVCTYNDNGWYDCIISGKHYTIIDEYDTEPQDQECDKSIEIIDNQEDIKENDNEIDTDDTDVNANDRTEDYTETDDVDGEAGEYKDILDDIDGDDSEDYNPVTTGTFDDSLLSDYGDNDSSDLTDDMYDDYDYDDMDYSNIIGGSFLPQESGTHVIDSNRRAYTTEQEIEWTKGVSSYMSFFIDSLRNEGNIMEIDATENCHYDPYKNIILLPLYKDFTTSGLTHEIIHLIQNKLGMLDTNQDSHASDNEYQAYVLNYILMRACQEIATAPKGAEETPEWQDLKDALHGNIFKDNNTIYMTRTFLIALNSADHESLSSAFRQHYYNVDKRKGSSDRKNYYMYHDPYYRWDWEKLLVELGFIFK